MKLAIMKLCGRCVLLGALLGAVPGAVLALAEPKTSASAQATAPGHVQLVPGVFLDIEHGMLEATGSCAADLFAASADVARIKAERLARLRAEERLRKALALLSSDEKHKKRLAAFGGAERVAHLDPTTARTITVDYAASGSVSLRLGLALAETAGTDLGVSSPPVDAGGDSGAPRPLDAR